jgi:hypothetical protein
MMPGAVFAVTRKAPESDAAGNVLSLMPGLVVVVDSETVDRIIETTPNDTRYFVGLMVWAPDELDEQIDQGHGTLPASAPGLWKSMSGIMV